MSIKHSNTTSDYLEWDTMLSLVHRLYRDGNYRISLLIGCGCFFGLRISDLKTLRWEQLLDGNSFELFEKKKLKYICNIIVYLDRPVAATCTLKKKKPSVLRRLFLFLKTAK